MRSRIWALKDMIGWVPFVHGRLDELEDLVEILIDYELMGDL